MITYFLLRDKMMKFPILALALSLLLAACGEYAAKGAGEGATMGAASGAVGGLVSALVFGGDPAEAAARGAVYGGAVGATAGAMSGSKVDTKIEQQREARADKIRKEIGDDAFKGLSALVTCDHADALQFAAASKQSSNPNFAVAGYWLEVLSYADQGKSDKTSELLPAVVEKDWDLSSEANARANLLQLQDKLMVIREEYKLPKNCE
jgi:predicted small secreted protein